ncbi:MAG: conjugal transfer protein TraR [Ignavibacteria bacterium]|nr:MAG: conjugal transfer protein TraR [Ignavibacteria bacterium]
MDFFQHAVIIGITILGLWYGASWVVISAAHIARKLGLSEVVIGLTIVAIGTSAPEFAVSITAAIKGQADISVGNVVGSNIFNLGFILGGVALLGACPTGRRLVFRDGSMLILTGALLALFLSDYMLEWWEGAILASLLLGYILFLFLQKETLDEEVPEGDFHWYDIPKIILGIALIILSSKFLVQSATEVAMLLGVSEWLIGVTIVAVGTSMPELATSFIAVIKGHHGISVGNLVGSDLFNLLGVLGLAAILRPLHVTPEAYLNILLLGGFMVVVVIVMRTQYRITRVEGAILLLLTAVRWWLNIAS